MDKKTKGQRVLEDLDRENRVDKYGEDAVLRVEKKKVIEQMIEGTYEIKDFKVTPEGIEVILFFKRELWSQSIEKLEGK